MDNCFYAHEIRWLQLRNVLDDDRKRWSSPRRDAQVIDCDDMRTGCFKSSDQMASHESGSSRHQYGRAGQSLARGRQHIDSYS